MIRTVINIKSFLSLPGKTKVKSIRMMLLLMQVWILVKVVPLKFYYARFFLASNSIHTDLLPFSIDIRLLQRIIQLLPVRITCLMHSMAMKLYLEHYNIEMPINLGVKTAGALKAHAWILHSQSNGFGKIYAHER